MSKHKDAAYDTFFLHLFIDALRCLRKHLEAPPSDDDDEAVAADPQWQ